MTSEFAISGLGNIDDQGRLVVPPLDQPLKKGRVHVRIKLQYVDDVAIRTLAGSSSENTDLLPAEEEKRDADLSSSLPIWEVFEQILADVPPEEFKKLPADGADRHDYYLYGSGQEP